MRGPITTHVLDTAHGKPAVGVTVVLEFEEKPGEWKKLASGSTDADGRISALIAPGTALAAGTYRMTFDTASYFRATNTKSFYPYVTIAFEVHETGGHYHIPLLLNAFGYSTYRGS